MTRDELPHAIGVALVKARERIPREEWSDYDGEADDILPLIDEYVAAERERIAQEIEAAAVERDRQIADIAGSKIVRRSMTTDGMRRAARIARAES